LTNINTALLENLNILENFQLKDAVQESKVLFNSYSDIRVVKKTDDFNQNIWSFFELTANAKFNINFSGFLPLINLNQNLNPEEFIQALKCWTIHNLYRMGPEVAHKKVSNLLSICTLTNGFIKNFDEFIELVSTNHIFTTDNTKSNKYIIKKVTSKTSYNYIHSILSFCDFYPDLPVDKDTINEIKEIPINQRGDKRSRSIPNISDLINFKDCIENFYDDALKQNDKSLLLKFYPLVLWWKITSIIPMRPSEFCMIRRECLKDDYLTFPRLKSRRNREFIRNNIQYDKLPVPNEIATIINHYISLTESFDNKGSLISLDAFLKYSFSKKRSDVDYSQKVFNKVFLNHLLKRFYREIVINQYNINFKQSIRLGDLRHIAITSMMLQGHDRVAIERLAGHFNPEMQYSYVDHMHFWIDSEIQHLANQFKLINDNYFTSPKAISYYDNLMDNNINEEILKHINTKVIETEYNHNFIELDLGFCTDQSMPCPINSWNYTGCYFCKHWGISIQDIKSNKTKILFEVSIIYNELHRKINYLAGLYNLHNFDNVGDINPQIKTKLYQTKSSIEREKSLVSKLKFLLESAEND